MALRQQLAVLKRRHPRPKLSPLDKLFWALACQFWSAWKQALMVVTPETVVRWHRAGFRLYWRLISRVKRRAGRKKLSKDVRHLIFRRWRRTPPGVLLGFTVSFSPARRWLSFLHNHREAIAAMDFFTVPTITFGGLYCFFIIGHDRRRILHFNVTRHPTDAWIVQQLREAFPYERATEFLLLDHDSKYGTEVPVAIRSMDIKAVRTAVGCPWQNGVAERWSEAAVANCWIT